MIYCIALTGSIASGKSTIAAMFMDLKVPVISSDHLAKNLTAQGQPSYNEILAHFGDVVRMPSGELDRRQLRSIIANDHKSREWLENLLHPLIRQGIIEAISLQTAPYCIIEIPLLKNTTHYPYLNRVLWVNVSYATQCERLVARDHCSEKEAHNFLKTQISNCTYQKIADDILNTNQSLEKLQQQVLHLHAFYLLESTKLSKQHALNTRT